MGGRHVYVQGVSRVKAPSISRDISKVILDILMAVRLTLRSPNFSKTKELWGNHLPLAPTGKPCISICWVPSWCSKSSRRILYFSCLARKASSRVWGCLSKTIVTSNTLVGCPCLVQIKSGLYFSPCFPVIVLSLSQCQPFFAATWANMSQIRWCLRMRFRLTAGQTERTWKRVSNSARQSLQAASASGRPLVSAALTG